MAFTAVSWRRKPGKNGRFATGGGVSINQAKANKLQRGCFCRVAAAQPPPVFFDSYGR